MEQYLGSHEARITWSLFVCAFVLIGVGETFRPRKALCDSTARRWIVNALLAACNIATEALYPLGGTAVALMVLKSPYGLLNSGKVPFLLRCAVGVVFLDFLRYAIHYLFHHSALLWRIHQVHHSDRDFDMTTGVRNHPGELVVVQVIQLATIALLAPPPAAVIITGIITGLHSLFSHANLHLPDSLDRMARAFLITPDVHRVHHSELFDEQNTNFGFLFPWWDKMFGTYRSAPAEGHEGMRIGLEELRDARCANALYLLSLPFRRLPSSAPETAVEERPRALGAAGGD